MITSDDIPDPTADAALPEGVPSAQGEPAPRRISYERLVVLARDRSAEARRQLTEAVSDLVAQRASEMGSPERQLIVDILERLIRDVEAPVRKALADRLARVADAPIDLVRSLAQDEIDVARSIVTHSVVLQESDLIEIVRHRSYEHQLAVALREHGVSAQVAEVLAETRQIDVIKALIENPNAVISRATMEYLVDEAKRFDVLQKPILQRSEIDPGLAKKLYWWVSAALRRHILERFRIDPQDLDDQLEAAVIDLVDASRSEGDQTRKAEALAQQLAKAEALTPTLVVQVLRKGEIPLFEAMFAELSQIRLSLLRRLLYEPGGEGLAIVTKALGVDKAVFASIFLLSRRARPGDQVVDPMELSRVLAFFVDLDVGAAEKMVKRWRRDPQFLEALWRVDSAGRTKS